MFSLGKSAHAQREPAPPVSLEETEKAIARVATAPPPPLVEPSAATASDTVEIADAAAIPDATEAKAKTRLTHAKTVEGSARSGDGATSPWLLLPAERDYHLYVPPHLSQRNGGDPLPLVIMIHGCRETAEAFERGTRMNTIADRESFAVLYPHQATFANIRRCWNWFEPNTATGKGECAIILEMIREARQHTKLDHTRVYVAGMSSGGALAGLLGYHHPYKFAAVAVHSGLPPMMPPSAAAAIAAMKKGVRLNGEMLADRYWKTHTDLPPPLIVLHGDKDETVNQQNATSMANLWEKIYENAPQGGQLVRIATEIVSSPNARAYSQIDLQRAGQTVVRGLRIHGLAHRWSGGDAALPFNDAKGPNASESIWKFFSEQQRAA